MILCPLHELGCGVSEASREARTGVSYLIYKLENYSRVSTVDIQGDESEAMTGKAGEPHTVQKCYDRFSSPVRMENRERSEVGGILTIAHREFGGCAHRCTGKPKRRDQD